MNRTLLAAGAAAIALAPGLAAGEPIALEDQRGNTVTLAAPAERMITFPMPAAALATSVAGTPEPLVAMHPSSMRAIREGILGTIYPDALDARTDITSGGIFNPNVEAVLALRPDLVIQWAGRGDDLLEPMDRVGLPVVGLNYGTQEDTENWVRLLAAAIGRPERADLILGWHERVMADIKARAAEIPAGERTSVIYFVRAEKKLEVRGEGSYNHFYLDMVGGDNPAGPTGSRFEINAEQLLAWDPDVLLLGNFDAAAPQDFYDDPMLSALSAVREKRVYKVPLGGYRWDPPSQESPLMWLWLAEVLYGDAMDSDIRAETARFFQEVYGYDLSDAEIDAILQFDLNGDNPSYARVAAAG